MLVRLYFTVVVPSEVHEDSTLHTSDERTLVYVDGTGAPHKHNDSRCNEVSTCEVQVKQINGTAG